MIYCEIYSDVIFYFLCSTTNIFYLGNNSIDICNSLLLVFSSEVPIFLHLDNRCLLLYYLSYTKLSKINIILSIIKQIQEPNIYFRFLVL